MGQHSVEGKAARGTGKAVFENSKSQRGKKLSNIEKNRKMRQACLKSSFNNFPNIQTIVSRAGNSYTLMVWLMLLSITKTKVKNKRLVTMDGEYFLVAYIIIEYT